MFVACASALSMEMTSATTQPSAVRRVCQTTGCPVSLRENGHRHCCAECRRTFGARHSRRCRDLQRRERASIQDAPSPTGNRLFPCCTSGCARVTTGTYLHCCSYCAESRGTLHSVRCQNRRGVTYPTGTTGPAEAATPWSTAATSVAGAGAEAATVLTAWNTTWPAPMAVTDARTNVENADDENDGDGRSTREEAGHPASARTSRWSAGHPLPNPTSPTTSEQKGASEAKEASSAVQPVKPVQGPKPMIDLEDMD